MMGYRTLTTKAKKAAASPTLRTSKVASVTMLPDMVGKRVGTRVTLTFEIVTQSMVDLATSSTSR